MSTEYYRVNFGQGTVHYVGSKAEGLRYLKDYCGECVGAFLQRYEGEGEWSTVKGSVVR